MERSVQHDLHLGWIPASGPIIKDRVKILEVLVCLMNLFIVKQRGKIMTALPELIIERDFQRQNLRELNMVINPLCYAENSVEPMC